jgi:tRNA (mo5U34)-methyltransferase
MNDELNWAKQQKWFYEFALPDGTRTESYEEVPVRKIHFTREKALRNYLSRRDWRGASAVDLACHEGFFSVTLAEYFGTVVGIDKNQDSLAKAARIARLVGRGGIRFENNTVENLGAGNAADFVLCFGLLYHTENTIEVLRRIAAITRRAVCIETQVLPFETAGRIEDGSYLSQRDLHGTFGLCVDYSHGKEGGLTDLALVPSRGALMFLLQQFGFDRIDVFEPAPDDYEQFVRGSRVIVYAEKRD